MLLKLQVWLMPWWRDAVEAGFEVAMTLAGFGVAADGRGTQMALSEGVKVGVGKLP